MMLERAVGMDQSYAPAWVALGVRYYYDAAYSNGGEAAHLRSDTALERALTLDPNLISAAGNLTANRVERGDLIRAYKEAVELVRRRPQSGEAHFSLSYVLRYAGLLEESGRECDTALGLDPANYQFRSCSWTFSQMGKDERALDFLRSDAGSEYANWVVPSILLGQGKLDEARQAVEKTSDNPVWHKDLLENCLHLRPGANLEKVARQTAASVVAESDPELWYYQGAILAYCGEKDIALRLLGRAISKNYCAYSALQADPLLSKLRENPDFRQLLSAAKDCTDKFMAGRNNQSSH